MHGNHGGDDSIEDASPVQDDDQPSNQNDAEIDDPPED